MLVLTNVSTAWKEFVGLVSFLVWWGVGYGGFFRHSVGKSFQGKFLVVGRHRIITVLSNPTSPVLFLCDEFYFVYQPE